MKIDQAALEKVLIDRALGVLSPEVEELLRAYLARDPEAATLARRLNETVDLAKRALQTEPDAPLPPFPTARMRRAQGNRRRRQRLVAAVGLAVSMLVGLGIGALWFRHGPTPGVGTTPVVQVEAVPGADPLPAPPREVQESGFWSLEVLANRALAASRGAPSRRAPAAWNRNRPSGADRGTDRQGSIWEIRHETFYPGS